MTLAVAVHDAALAEDCRRAAILVVKFPGPKICTTPQVQIDSTRLRLEGAHAIYLTGRGIEVVTVEQLRGDRPWSPRAKLPTVRRIAGGQPDAAERRGRPSFEADDGDDSELTDDDESVDGSPPR